MLKVTTLHDDMILSILSISSHDFARFALGFPKLPPNNPPPRPMELSNSLPLIEAQLILWSSRTKYTLCSTLEDSIDMTKLRT